MSRDLRYIILAVMAALTVLCGLMMKNINIYTDMTKYLPKTSQMKVGLDTLHCEFPFIDTDAPKLRAMFRIDPSINPDSLLLRQNGVKSISSRRQNDTLVLLEAEVSRDTDLLEVSSSIKRNFATCVATETNANSNMPENLGELLMCGALVILIILLLMCSSVMEALLFVITIGMAVVMNMGTNAFLPGVSMMTNTIVGILQFVLSMDYSIILMNRFRLEECSEADIYKRMSKALKDASSSILSSSFTTIVGLLALVFMKFRIGMDLGIVLAKGVFFSLISIYTILPALILIFHKAIIKTGKKVPLIGTNRLAVYEIKFRWTFTFVFFALFVTTYMLQKRTELSYASVWESKIAEVFPARSSFMLLYRTSDEEKVIGIIDSLSRDTNVVSAISYPSLMKVRLTASETHRKMSDLLAMLPEGTDLPVDTILLSEDNIRLMFYAATHPERDEKMSFFEMMELAENASDKGIVPDGIDIDKMIAAFTKDAVGEDTSVEEHVEEAAVVGEEQHERTIDTVKIATHYTDSTTKKESSISENSRKLTYEDCIRKMSSEEMAGFLGFDATSARRIYKMADCCDEGMTPSEFTVYVKNTILKNRILRASISKNQKRGLETIYQKIDSVIKAGPVIADVPTETVSETADTVSIKLQKEEFAGGQPDEQTTVSPAAKETMEETSLDRLFKMAVSGNKYSEVKVKKALREADVEFDADLIDLMYLYYGASNNKEEISLSLEEIVDYLSDRLPEESMFSSLIDDEARSALKSLKQTVQGSIGMLRNDNWSFAAAETDYPVESAGTFDFVHSTMSLCDSELEGEHHFIGEPVMICEMKDGFRKELVLLTILTIISIFLIVAITFRSLIIPTILVMAVLTGVYINVTISGIGGRTMLYLAYLIVQSILMGATIDYGILFTNFYLEFRRQGTGKVASMQKSYKGSIHTIMTSGLILILAPFAMSKVLHDPAISSILSNLTLGALSALLVIIFLLPAALAAFDKIICRKPKH